MAYEYRKIGSLKEGKYIVDPRSGQACLATHVVKVAPGKHGKAKVIATLIGLFDGQLRELMLPVDRSIKVPVIDKRAAQVITVNQDSYTLMDSKTSETFEVIHPKNQKLKEKIECFYNEGKGFIVDYWVVMGEKLIVAAKVSQ